MSLIYRDHRTGAKLYQCGAKEIPNYLRSKNLDLIVFSAKKFQPKVKANIRKVYVPFEDKVLMSGAELDDTLDKALLASDEVTSCLAQGKDALVTCWAGLNRSGLINGMVLIDFAGMSGRKAIHQIQRHRQGALYNPKFRKILLAY